MSADFSKILVKDDRLECVDNIKYAVIKGGQNVTPSQFKAISVSNNQLVFNVQVPSEQTIIDRRVLLQTDLTLVVTSSIVETVVSAVGAAFTPTLSAPPNGCGYGSFAGLAPYPLHQLMVVSSTTINNNTVTVNTQDVLPAILRMLDKKELGSYNGTTSTATDSLLSYTDAIGSYANANNAYSSSTLDTDFMGRGSIALKNYVYTTTATAAIETFTWRISEPLMLSPWIYCNPKTNGQGFYGIQNLNIVLNIDSNVSRVFRGLQGVNGLSNMVTLNTQQTGGASVSALYSSPGGSCIGAVVTPTAPFGAVEACTSLPVITKVEGLSNGLFSADTSLLFTFLTPHPSDLMPARNIVPYYELPRFITNGVAVPSTASVIAGASKNIIIPGIDNVGGTSFVSQTLQLNQIPDKLILYISKTTKTWSDSDSMLPITHISIDFNNNSGLLSAAKCEDLYRMSKDNGSNQNWVEWSGYTNTVVEDNAGSGSNLTFSSNGFPSSASGSNVSFKTVPTCGSMLMLEFGKDIQLVEDFFAPGSLGNFNIRVNVYYLNNNPGLTGSSANVSLTMITLNSGVFVCERGTSSTYTGILTRADVLEASDQDAYTHSDVRRLVGGGFLDMLKSGVSKLAPMLKSVAPILAPMAKNYLASKGPLGQMGANMMTQMGYGQSGGGGSGGALQGRYR